MNETKEVNEAGQVKKWTSRRPLGPLIEWVKAHPRLSAWLVLAVGMDAMVAYEAREVGLHPGQWVALIVATTLVAGLCIWIIGWDDDEEQPEGATPERVEK